MQKRKYISFKNKAVAFRKQGNTYGDIQKILGKNIPKSTFSLWFKDIQLTKQQREKIRNRAKLKSHNSLMIAWVTNKKKRGEYLDGVKNRIKHLKEVIENRDVAKIALTMLYLGEGHKTKRGSMALGNSDPNIIKLFLKLMRQCYKIEEAKFRCTLQCRADQNIKELEKFWSKTTRISLQQFYGARIDPRTIGKPTKKLDYKGVCKIDYFSADLYNELTKIAEVITMGL